MRTLVGFGVSLLLATGLAAQYRGGVGNTQPFVRGSFGNAVFPGGTSAMPGVQRGGGNVVFPGGSGPQFIVPGSVTDPTFGMRLGGTVAGQPFRGRPSGNGGHHNTGTVVTYGFPVYVGGYGYVDNSYPAEEAPPQQQQQQQPNITIIMPPQPAPLIINHYGNGPDDAQYSATATAPPPESQQAEEPAPITEPSHYLIAFKDHSVYSAVAYWVDGDTLHYFTSGNTHNQASLSLVDRDLTKRLNEETGLEIRLPPAK